jgi:AcrR family transcriptional regulator
MVQRETGEQSRDAETGGHAERPLRADAQRNIDKLLETALAVFTTSGVDAPMRQIAEKAGVGVGTIYRHFPHRSELIAAVFRREIDACAQAARDLPSEYEPFEALVKWMDRFVDFVVTKRGLAAALHKGDAAYEGLPAYLDRQLRPALQGLLDTAIADGHLRGEVKPNELLQAASSLCGPARDVEPGHARRMVRLLLDGLRYDATQP